MSGRHLRGPGSIILIYVRALCVAENTQMIMETCKCGVVGLGKYTPVDFAT